MEERARARHRGRERKVARIASIGVGVFAILGTLAVGSGFNVTVLVSMAFVFAASANFPPLILALLWRRFNTTGALTGIAFGIIASVVMIVPQPARVARPRLAGLALVADVPGPGHDSDRVPRLLAGHHAQPPRGDDGRHLRRAARALGDRHRL